VKVTVRFRTSVTETIDYGTIAHNSNGKRGVFTNNGTKPLIITPILKVHVVVLYQLHQEPIAPGAKE
jgi:hypothetical protein